MPIIDIENYSKLIKKRPVLNSINYHFENGTIYGLHGQNGSGKTMLLRAISGLIFPTTGTVTIDGKLLQKDIDFPPHTGIIIEHTELLPNMTGYENLKMLSKINKTATDDDILDSLKQVGLGGHEHTKVKNYSLGMKQKLSLAQAIFEKPSLLLLDEPTNALDEDSVQLIHDILLDLKERGCTIILATHNKEELLALADHIMKMVDGELID